MAIRDSLLAMAALPLVVILAGCAASPTMEFKQSLALRPSPRTLAVESSEDVPLPPQLSETVRRQAAKAGFAVEQGHSTQYLLYLAVSVSAPRVRGLAPADDSAVPATSPAAPPRRTIGSRLRGGSVSRVTAVLIDVAADREVWRGTGSLQTKRPADALPLLGERILAEMPRDAAPAR
jgi:hypothetical protein